MAKKLGAWGLVAFFIFFVAYRPQSAANVARWLGTSFSGLAMGFGDFVSRLVS